MPTSQQHPSVDAKRIGGLNDDQRAHLSASFAAHDVGERTGVKVCAPFKLSEAQLADDTEGVDAHREVLAQEDPGSGDAPAVRVVDKGVGRHSRHLRYGQLTTPAERVSSAISSEVCASCHSSCLAKRCAYPLVREGRAETCRRFVCGACAFPVMGVGNCCGAHARVLQRRGLVRRARA